MTYNAFIQQNYYLYMLGDKEILDARKRLGQRLREIRKECHVPQHELARYFFVDRSHISRLETGKTPITFDELVLFASLFSLSLIELVHGIVPQLEKVAKRQSNQSGKAILENERKSAYSDKTVSGDAFGPQVTEKGEELAGPWVQARITNNWDAFERYSWALGANGWEILIG